MAQLLLIRPPRSIAFLFMLYKCSLLCHYTKKKSDAVKLLKMQTRCNLSLWSINRYIWNKDLVLCWENVPILEVDLQATPPHTIGFSCSFVRSVDKDPRAETSLMFNVIMSKSSFISLCFTSTHCSIFMFSGLPTPFWPLILSKPRWMYWLYGNFICANLAKFMLKILNF